MWTHGHHRTILAHQTHQTEEVGHTLPEGHLAPWLAMATPTCHLITQYVSNSLQGESSTVRFCLIWPTQVAILPAIYSSPIPIQSCISLSWSRKFCVSIRPAFLRQTSLGLTNQYQTPAVPLYQTSDIFAGSALLTLARPFKLFKPCSLCKMSLTTLSHEY